VAPNFRYERPQKGRFRQHHQLGVEALGSDDPELDVEVIALAHGVYRDLGLRQVTLLLNSLGDAECRPRYLDRLTTFLAERAASLCEEHRERYVDNPLRVLDCKRECAAATTNAPRAVDHLCADCEEHFARVKAGLDALDVAFTIEPRLVRGLDYYTRTTFELQATALDAAQNGIGGGGRYDGLAEALGGPPTPGIGFGMGIERILLACDAEGVFPAPAPAVQVWVVDVVGEGDGRAIVHELREAGLGADRALDQRSMKAQFKAADRSGARFAVVVGEQERAQGTVSVRPLRGEGEHEQESVTRPDLVAHLRKRLQP
jgi:histidyl-tRNA synthetase